LDGDIVRAAVQDLSNIPVAKAVDQIDASTDCSQQLGISVGQGVERSD
jgi:hypothetical protein